MVIKEIRITHSGGFQDGERRGIRALIHSNVIVAFKAQHTRSFSAFGTSLVSYGSQTQQTASRVDPGTCRQAFLHSHQQLSHATPLHTTKQVVDDEGKDFMRDSRVERCCEQAAFRLRFTGSYTSARYEPAEDVQLGRAS